MTIMPDAARDGAELALNESDDSARTGVLGAQTITDTPFPG